MTKAGSTQILPPVKVALSAAEKALYGQATNPQDSYVKLSIAKILVHLCDLCSTKASANKDAARDFFFSGDSTLEIFTGCAGLSTEWVREIAAKLERAYAA